MTLDTFQVLASATAIYPNRGGNVVYPVLGLLGEAGELANAAKRIQRDDGGELTAERRAEMVDELGDVLWYAAALATELDTPLSDVCNGVLSKLAGRAERGTINGKGGGR